MGIEEQEQEQTFTRVVSHGSLVGQFQEVFN